ncbi:MAG: TetR/AcrR family transcriptional regulator [Deltaproteobacteria bacterium]|nr:TetR/AcrR family transcriptional regulator [Deltaproteobacteria bacterium]
MQKNKACGHEEKRDRRRQENRRRQQQEILDAALKLFAERGYHHVSINDIAREAAYAVGTIYKFFPGKEELYRAIIHDLGEKFTRAATVGLEGEGDAKTIIADYLAATSRVFQENSTAIRLYFAETQGASFNFRAGLDRETRAMHEEIQTALARVFARGIENGEFIPLDPGDLARALDSMALSFHFAWLDDPVAHPISEGLETLKRIFFFGISRATGKPQSHPEQDLV